MPPLYFCEKSEVSMHTFPFRLPALRDAALFAALAAGMVLFNFALPQREPAAFFLLWAAFVLLHAYAAATCAYLAASAVFLLLGSDAVLPCAGGDPAACVRTVRTAEKTARRLAARDRRSRPTALPLPVPACGLRPVPLPRSRTKSCPVRVFLAGKRACGGRTERDSARAEMPPERRAACRSRLFMAHPRHGDLRVAG